MIERAQVRAVRAVVEWYVRQYHDTAYDNGGPAMYCDRGRLGHFAAQPSKFTAGHGPSLFRLLIASTLFQRRQDQQVFRILRSLSREQVAELSTPGSLVAKARLSSCGHFRTLGGLHLKCDLEKHPVTRKGICSEAPRTRCPPKLHTVLLRRYADFGKVPSSAALALYQREPGLAHYLRRIVSATTDRSRRSEMMLAHVMTVWRTDVKIASMFLSALSNPDLGGPRPPWTVDLDWSAFVVVDSNVDRFLALVGLRINDQPYAVRREALHKLAAHVPMNRIKSGMTRTNTRLVQQAIYAFMSLPNRRANSSDCLFEGESVCSVCELARLCPVRSRQGRDRSAAITRRSPERP